MLPTLNPDRHNLSAMFVTVSSVVLNVDRQRAKGVVAQHFVS